MKLDMFRTLPLSIISSILVLPESCLQTCITYTIAECTVDELMMDRGTVRNIEFHAKNELAELVHLFRLIIKKFVRNNHCWPRRHSSFSGRYKLLTKTVQHISVTN